MLFTAVISIHLRALSQKALRSDPHICNVYLPGIIGSRIHYKASLAETKSNRCICQESTTKHPSGVRADPTGNIQCQLKSFRHIHIFYGFRIDAFHRAAQSYTEQGIYNHIIFICLRITVCLHRKMLQGLPLALPLLCGFLRISHKSYRYRITVRRKKSRQSQTVSSVISHTSKNEHFCPFLHGIKALFQKILRSQSRSFHQNRPRDAEVLYGIFIVLLHFLCSYQISHTIFAPDYISCQTD